MEKCGGDEQATDGSTVRRMRFACWINKAANTHSEYVIFIASPRQPLTRKSLNVAFYVHGLFFLELLRKTWAEEIRGLMEEKGLMEEEWNDRDTWKKKII